MAKKDNEIDSSGLDAIRNELIDAVESGAIRAGEPEDGLFDAAQRHVPAQTSNSVGSGALSSSANGVVGGDADRDYMMEKDQRAFENTRGLGAVEFVDVPTEKTRNQKDSHKNEQKTRGGLKITRQQNTNIRNYKLEEEPMIHKQRRQKRIKKALRVVLALFLILVVAYGAGFGWYEVSLRAPMKANDSNPDVYSVSFAVVEGESTAQIAENLKEQGLIRSSLAFRIYLRFEAKDQNLLSGNYVLSKTDAVPAIVQSLNKGASAKTRKIMFLPGGTLAQAKQALMSLGYSEQEIDDAFKKDYTAGENGYKGKLFEGKPAGSTLEGYIFGDTYEIYESATVEQILIYKVFPEMENFINEQDLISKFKARGYSLYEGIQMASIVQREAGSLVGDMPDVAQVFYNRLKQGIPLGSDAVVAYRADQLNPMRDKADLSYFETTPCPWNSRKCAGMPPSPIATPGKDALLAAANPSDNTYIYFLTGDDNKMYYAHTQDEHDVNIRKFCKQRCKVF